MLEETGNECLKENEFKQMQAWIYTDPNGYHIFPKTEKRDIWAEAERLYNKEFPEPKQQPKPVNENQIKKFSALLEDVSKY